jgi:hypothetical protein
MFRAFSFLRPRPSNIAKGSVRDHVRGGVAVTLSAIAVLAFGLSTRAMLGTDRVVPERDALIVETAGAYVPSSDNWLDQLTNPSAWRSGRFRSRQRPMSRAEEREMRLQEEREEREARLRDEREEREEAMERARELGRERGTFRTMCVRLCDGFFFPISFATTPDRFATDEAACRSRCGSPARLYVYPNPGGEPEQMHDARGQPYSALKNAFLFRTTYSESCTCKPHPWQQEALSRHRAFVERAAGAKHPVAAKVQPAPREIDAAAASPVAPAQDARGPEGAMLLGAQRAPPPPVTKKEPTQEPRRGGGKHGYGGASDWRNRAFSTE